ncbi:MAG: hypothetical protein LBT53_04915 [Puniceicoccales bacterium]|jgi:hypothetical protein|nr:hypothetical protein [Puniceicoccales bacterium]
MKLLNVVVGYHGCPRYVGEKVLLSEHEHLLPSANPWDWLGGGVYFWEDNPQRALEWAKKNKQISDPFVIGAMIRTEDCLDLTEVKSIDLLKYSYNSLKQRLDKAGTPLPENKPFGEDDKDEVRRYLDCAVIENAHETLKESGQPPYASVRGIFSEGLPIFSGAEIHSMSHAQIAVRDTRSILAYFRPRSAE